MYYQPSPTEHQLRSMSSNDEVLTTPRSVIGEELEKQSNIDQRLSFCFDEERRKMKSFQERSNDLDQAIKWVLKEIVSCCQNVIQV